MHAKPFVIAAVVAFFLLSVAAILGTHDAHAMRTFVPGGEAPVQMGVRLASLPVVAAAATPTCEPSWGIVGSPNIGLRNNELYGVSAPSANDVWAVGYYIGEGVENRKNLPQPKAWHPLPDSRINRKDGYGAQRTLVEHWNGTAWTVISSPNLGQDDNSLLEVDAVSANDVWAAGYYINELGLIQTLAEHWDGTRWSVVPTPNNALQDNLLNSVDAVSANDVWAVGYYVSEKGITQTLIEHWDGARWSIIVSPNAGAGENLLRDVTVVSASDVWAVGYYIIPRGIYRTLTTHWDGVRWSIVQSPNVASETQLYSVDAVSANDVWAIGYYRDTRSIIRTLTIHWDGSAWSVVPSPSIGSFDSQLFSVDAISANDVWAVGRYANESYLLQTLILHWDGRIWSIVRSPNVGEYMDNILFSVAVVSANDVWTVGRSGGYSSSPRTLTEHYSTTCVACSIYFTDVPQENTFYPYAQCLACQNIISGYECGEQGEPCDPNSNPYFRPNARITRGQLAKIVSNSAGFLENPGSPIFEDVSPYDPFYQWVNRLARRSIIGGYQCGASPEERCYPPENRPYFRPYANATRGQISKIVSNAANYMEAPTGQTFQDVPPNSPFYVWIERLASRGAMGGYPCGTSPEEPCGIPNRPYFRPNNNATRGQVSKIVANTFFPNCYTPAQP